MLQRYANMLNSVLPNSNSVEFDVIKKGQLRPKFI